MEEQYHTVSIRKRDDSQFEVIAESTETADMWVVGSVSLSKAAVGVDLDKGNVARFEAAERFLEVEHTDFSELDRPEQYEEVAVNFGEKS